MPELDDDVIRRARQGDMAAFEAVYRHYAGMVYRVSLRMTGRVEDAEEVTQQVFLAVHRSLKTFAGQSTLKTWIYRITVNCSLNEIKRRISRPEVGWDEGFDPEDARHEAVEAVEKEAQQQKIGELLEYLNPDQKACLVLRAQEGLSYEDIARTLCININTVRTRIKRARETLLALHGKK